MAKINIVIADSDELYLNHLTNYLIEHINKFDVYSFTSKESFIRYISDPTNKVDIIAFTEELMHEAIINAGAPAKILLSDGSYTSLTEFDHVNKYQKAEKFVNDILLIYAEQTGHVEAVSTGDKDTEIIGFFSPVGGAGKTALALGTACALAQTGKRVFYLNAEKINSTADVLNEANSGSLSDLYLSLKTKGANAGLRIVANKYTDANNITYINPAESSLEINELTGDEFIRLIKEFESLGDFDVVILDFETEFNHEKAKILSAVDKIFMPYTADCSSVAKMKLFYKELGMYDEYRPLLEKIYPVLNKMNAQSNAYLQSAGITGVFETKASIALSPVFTEFKTLMHSGNSAVQIFSGIINNI